MTAPNIKLIYDSRNFTIVKDNLGLLWLASDQKYVAYYDKKIGKFGYNKEDMTDRAKTHFGVFKKMIRNCEI